DGALDAGGALGVVEQTPDARARQRAADAEAVALERAVEARRGDGQAEQRHRIIGAEGAGLGLRGGGRGDEGKGKSGGESGGKVSHGFPLPANSGKSVRSPPMARAAASLRLTPPPNATMERR